MKRILYFGKFPAVKGSVDELTEELIVQAIKQFNIFSETDPNKIVTFIFGDCRGGEFNSALSLAELIIKSSVPTISIATGKTFSAAALVASSAQIRLGLPNSTFMLHPPKFDLKNISIADLGKDGRLPPKIRGEIGLISRRMYNVLQKGSRLTGSSIKYIMTLKQDIVMPAKMAHEQIGLLDAIIPPLNP